MADITKIQHMNDSTQYLITTSQVSEPQLNKVNITNWINTSANIHNHETQGEMLVRRFFASDDAENYSTSYDLPCVDSHNLIFSIDKGTSWNRVLSLDMRTNDLYTRAKTNGTWGSWEKLVRNTGTWGISITGTAAKLSNTPNNTTTFLRGDNTFTNTLTNTFISTASPGFTNTVSAGAWAYLRLNTSAYIWDIAANSSSSSNHLELRGNGGDTYKFRFTTDGRLEVYNQITANNSIKLLSNGGESTIAYADRSGTYTTWTVGRGPGGITNTFGWWNGSKNVMTLTNDGKLHLSGPCADSVGAFSVADTRTDAGWHYPFLGTCAGLSAGGNMYICIGKAASTGNAAGLRYNWQAASSDSNLMGFEFYGQGTKLWVYANGNGGVTGSWSAPTGVTASSGSIWAGTDGNTAAERQVGVRSGAGSMYMWSHAATSGQRGIWLPAHGSGAARTVFSVDTNNNVTFNGNLAWGLITGKPSTFTPSGHRHSVNELDWPNGANLTTTGGGEWSIDMNGDGYWHVWSGTNGGSCLQCFNNDRHSWAYKLYGAVWNDYAEFRETKEEIEPGRCITEVGDDTLILTTKRLMRGCEIVSDTFGMAIGQSERCNTPTAASGRVLAYPYESLDEFKKHIGYCVCSGPNGTVSIMTDEEEEKYPGRIIGTISAVPDYDIWYCGDSEKPDEVKVNGRVWIRVK